MGKTKKKNGQKNGGNNRVGAGLDIRTIKIPDKGTLLENFQAYVEEHPADGDVIDFLSVTNAQYLCVVGMGKMTVEKEDEVVEFAEYFREKYYGRMRRAMYDNWGQEPYILSLAADIVESRK